MDGIQALLTERDQARLSLEHEQVVIEELRQELETLLAQSNDWQRERVSSPACWWLPRF